MRTPTYTDSKQGLAQACDLLRYAEQAKKRMTEARRKISLPPAGYLWVLAGMIIFVLILVVAHQNQPKPVAPASPERITAPSNSPSIPEVRRASLVVPEVRRASYVIGAHYNNLVFRGTKVSIDDLMRVPNPQEGDMYWVPATGNYWFLTRVGSTHRLSWVDP
jgi:hypothetical protein